MENSSTRSTRDKWPQSLLFLVRALLSLNHVQQDLYSFIFSKIIHWNNLANQQFLKLQLRSSLSTFIDIPILFSSPFLEFTIALQPLSRFNSFRAGPRLETRLNGHRCNVNRTRGDGNWINVSVRERSRVETSAKGYRNLFSKDEDQVAEEKNRTKSIPFRDISKTASLFPRGGKTESLGYRVEWRGSLFRLTASSHARIAYTSVSTDTTRPLCPSPPLSNVLPQTRSKFPMKI